MSAIVASASRIKPTPDWRDDERNLQGIRMALDRTASALGNSPASYVRCPCENLGESTMTGEQQVDFHRRALEFAKVSAKKFFDEWNDDDGALCRGPDTGRDFNAFLSLNGTDWQSLLRLDKQFAEYLSDEYHLNEGYEYRVLLVRMCRPVVN